MRLIPSVIRSITVAAVFLTSLIGAPAAGQTISISDAAVLEGNSPAVTSMTFNLTLSAPAAGVTRVRYATSGGTALTTTSNPGATLAAGVTIPAGAPANTAVGVGSPYPSTLNVAGLMGRLKSMSVTLVGLTHTWADDLDILLVGPGGQKVILMSDAGGGNDPNGDFTFSDLAAAKPPDSTVGGGAAPLPAGVYRPSDYSQVGESLPGPAPAGPYASLMSVFNGTDPNGTWSLYISDDEAEDVGALTAWSLNIEMGTGDYAGQEGAVEFLTGETAKTITIPVFGDALVEPSETFNVTLSALEGAGITIADGTGVGTITADDLPPSRVFVSIGGNDANDCSVITSPCLSLAASLLQVAAHGEVIFLTGGEYDSAPIAITKGVKVNAPTGVVAFISQPITVNAPGSAVVLRGLTLKGSGTGTGVTLVAASALYVENTTLDRWTYGVHVQAPTAQVFVTGSVFRFMAQYALTDTSAAAGAKSILVEQSRFEGNFVGMDINTSAVTVRETVFAANDFGFGAGGSVSVQGCELTGNSTGAVVFGGTVRLDRTLIHGNTIGFNINSGVIQTLGTNVIRENGSNVGVLTPLAGG